jgi:hypothetical protein
MGQAATFPILNRAPAESDNRARGKPVTKELRIGRMSEMVKCGSERL